MILIDSIRRLSSEAQSIARSLECMHIANDGFDCKNTSENKARTSEGSGSC